MGRRALAALSVALCACGDAPAPPERDAAAGVEKIAQRASAPQSGPQTVVTRADIDALLTACWSSDSTEGKRARASFAARGESALRALVAALPEYQSGDMAQLLDALAAFGVRACPEALALLPRLDEVQRNVAWEWLGERRDDWRCEPVGPDVCRAFLAYADAEPDAHGLDRRWEEIAGARPAGRAVIAELARRYAGAEIGWVTEAIGKAIASLGTDAAEAAPLVAARLAAADQEQAESAAEVLRAIRAADPSVLIAMKALLAEGEWWRRAAACRVLAGWGEDAVSCGPALVALLADESGDVVEEACVALQAMPSLAARHAVAALVLLTGGEDTGLDTESRVLLRAWFRDAAAAKSLVDAAPALLPNGARCVLEVLAGSRGTTLRDVATALLAHTDPETRARAAAVVAESMNGLPTNAMLRLLDDPVPWVRIEAARALVKAGAMSRERARAIVVALRMETDPRVQSSALSLLVEADVVETGDIPWIAAVAAEEPWIAIRALAKTAGPLPAESSRIAPRIAEVTLGSWEHRRDGISVLERIPGGRDVLFAAIRRPFAGPESDSSCWRDALETAAALGRRAAPLREELAALRHRIEEGYVRIALDVALASVDGDADGIAASAVSPTGAEELDALLRLGDAGRFAIVLGVGRELSHRIPEEVLRDGAMPDVVRACSRGRPGDPHADDRRAGAVRLSSILPATETRDLLVRLASDPNSTVRLVVAREIESWAERDPASVPLAALEPLLADTDERGGDWQTRSSAARAAARLGSRGVPLLPALRALVTNVPSEVVVLAAIAAWRISGRSDDALPSVRRALVYPSGLTASDSDQQENVDFTGLDWVGEIDGAEPPWNEIWDAIVELPFTEDDIPVLLRAARRRRVWGYSGAQAGAAFLALSRFGPRAAAAIPDVRTHLAELGPPFDRDREPREDAPGCGSLAEAITLLLKAAGPAARDALPDLRRAVAVTGDRTRHLRAAIAFLETQPR